MEKQINIDVDKLTMWDAIKIRAAVGRSDEIILKHEGTGLGWVASAIVLAALIISGVYK